jgi:hypothetical protein
MKHLVSFAALSVACTAVLVGSAQTSVKAVTGYKVQNRFSIKGTDGWDYITVDSAARRLYLLVEPRLYD